MNLLEAKRNAPRVDSNDEAQFIIGHPLNCSIEIAYGPVWTMDDVMLFNGQPVLSTRGWAATDYQNDQQGAWSDRERFYLVIYQDNWADEMDVFGMAVADTQWMTSAIEALEVMSFPYTHYVGTNEEIEYRTPQRLLGAYTITEITSEEAAVFKKHVGDLAGEIGPLFD